MVNGHKSAAHTDSPDGGTGKTYLSGGMHCPGASSLENVCCTYIRPADRYKTGAGESSLCSNRMSRRFFFLSFSLSLFPSLFRRDGDAPYVRHIPSSPGA